MTQHNATYTDMQENLFDGWLDTIVLLNPVSGLTTVNIAITGRDSESRDLLAEFLYPLWRLIPSAAAAESRKVADASNFIIGQLGQLGQVPGNQLAESQLRISAAFNGYPTRLGKGIGRLSTWSRPHNRRLFDFLKG